MRSERQALADIAALCAYSDDMGFGLLPIERLRVILADVQTEPAPARTYVDAQGAYRDKAGNRVDAAGNRIAELAPAGGTIDRDALEFVLTAWLEDDYPYEQGDTQTYVDEVSVREVVSLILAVVRPVEGVVLTREEALLAADALRKVRVDETRVHYTKYLTLAERLETAS